MHRLVIRNGCRILPTEAALMGGSPTLVAALVDAIGEPKPAVEVTLRRLRDAGLIPVGGRGPYSVRMTYDSAMRMLLASCASETLERDANRMAVERFEKLSGGQDENETIASAGIVPADVRLTVDALGPEHTLGEALIALLQAAAEDRLDIFEEGGSTSVPYKAKGYLRVSFYRPIPVARIEHVVGHVRKVWRYGFLGGAPLAGYIAVMRERNLGGRMQMSEIDEQTFRLIGAAIAK